MRHPLRRPAPATVIALAALGVALGGTSYAAKTIGTADLKANAVTSAKIKDGGVGTADLKKGAVTGPKIRARAVGTTQLGLLSVTTDQLADGSVTTPKLAPAAVTTDRLADAAVTAPKLADNAVTGAKIADNAIHSDDVADSSLTANDIKDGEVIKGNGFMFYNTLKAPDGTANQQLLNFEGIGRLLVSCAGGQTTVKFQNTSTTDVTVVSAELFRDAATGTDPAIKSDVDAVHRSVLPAGTSLLQDSQQGTGGIQAIQWQASYSQAGKNHVVTAWTTAGAEGSTCSVTAQALSTN